MAVEFVKENWVGKVQEITLGATPANGGTRKSTVTVGGETTLPFLHFEGNMPNKPVVAMEIFDIEPVDWPDVLKAPFGDALKSPADWAVKCVNEFGADMICIRLVGADPEGANKSPEEAAAAVKSVLEAVDVPVIVIGCGNFDKDNALYSAVSQIGAGENLLMGIAVADNYKSLVAACMMNNHAIISQSPLDINLQKQMNILITEMGLPAEKIVIDPMTGGLGYGLEYCYSIMERVRLGSLQGDKMLSMPMLVWVGAEAWRAKEAKETEEKMPEWGQESKRSPLWETITATSLLQAGADILVMRHPEAVAAVKKHIDKLMTA